MSKNAMKITVSGVHGIGKTLIKNFLAQKLRDIGIKTIIDDQSSSDRLPQITGEGLGERNDKLFNYLKENTVVGFVEVSDYKAVEPKNKPKDEDAPGYHLSDIPKGNLGEISKIVEEALELQDAHRQNSKIMELVELADLYGAIESYINRIGIDFKDLKKFSDITKRAFENGRRK